MACQSVKRKQRARAFWFLAQAGVCHLRCTQACVAVDGKMLLEAGDDARNASWDHLKPRKGGKYRPGKNKHSVLLACRGCNCARGCEPIAPDDPRWTRAKDIGAAWRADVKRRASVKGAQAGATL